MDHRTAFEDNVLATLCTKILPVYFPSLVYAEIGSVVLNQFKTSDYHTENGQCKLDGNSDHAYALVSPDGVLINKTLLNGLINPTLFILQNLRVLTLTKSHMQ